MGILILVMPLLHPHPSISILVGVYFLTKQVDFCRLFFSCVQGQQILALVGSLVESQSLSNGLLQEQT